MMSLPPIWMGRSIFSIIGWAWRRRVAVKGQIRRKCPLRRLVKILRRCWTLKSKIFGLEREVKVLEGFKPPRGKQGDLEGW